MNVTYNHLPPAYQTSHLESTWPIWETQDYGVLPSLIIYEALKPHFVAVKLFIRRVKSQLFN